METIAIREATKLITWNKVGDILIRSDSTAAIQRVKDITAGLGQKIVIEVKKIISKINEKVHIE